MAGLPVHKLEISSHKGSYRVEFTASAIAEIAKLPQGTTQLLIDAKVYELYRSEFSALNNYQKTLVVADEANKNIDKISEYIAGLMQNQIKLDHTLVAIGGGIVQDITCFLAATLFRGMKWVFVPTTLLAQADSCIGSKSSINVGEFKNLMGTFTPPQAIYLDIAFLDTLEPKDIASGIGEILKVHMVKSIAEFERALSSIDKMKSDRRILRDFIEKSLSYKKELVELDEFDKGPRNVMNYGHSFGHAIESVTRFAIPHGVAITIGMDMANYQSMKMDRIGEAEFQRWHSGLAKNYFEFASVPIDFDSFLTALRKDKKNIGADLALILPRLDGPIEKVKVAGDEDFISNCLSFFATQLSPAKRRLEHVT